MSKKRKPEPNYKDFDFRPSDWSQTEEEKRLREELKEYRKKRKKVWYL